MKRNKRPVNPSIEELTLEAEFADIQAGVLSLEKAPTFNRIANANNQSVHEDCDKFNPIRINLL